MEFTQYEFTLPAHWALPLIMNDYEGLNDEERQQVRKFLSLVGVGAETEYKIGHWSVENDEEPSFHTHHDARKFGVLQAECQHFTFNAREEV